MFILAVFPYAHTYANTVLKNSKPQYIQVFGLSFCIAFPPIQLQPFSKIPDPIFISPPPILNSQWDLIGSYPANQRAVSK